MDIKEFEQIYRTYAPSIYRFVNFRTGNREVAEDITSEVFISLYKSDFSEVKNIQAWLFKVARNNIYDEYFQVKNSEVKHKTDNLDDINESELELSNINTEAAVFEELELERIKSVLNQISAGEIIALKIWDELKFKEIADIIGEAEDTVKKRFYRGMEELKMKLNSDTSSVRLHSISLPILISAIFTAGKQSALFPSTTALVDILEKVGTNLNINFNTMTEVTGAAALATKGVIASFFASGTAKLATAAVLSVGVVSGGVAGIYFIDDALGSNNPQLRETTSSQSVTTTSATTSLAGTTAVCVLKPYTNSNYPEFGFAYNSCEWKLQESDKAQPTAQVITPLPPVKMITLTGIQNPANKMDMVLNPLPVFGFGPTACHKGEYEILAQTTGRFKNSAATWTYASDLQKYREGIITESPTAFVGSDYCYAVDGFVQVTNYTQNKQFNPYTEKMSAIISVKYTGDKLEKADEIVKSMMDAKTKAYKTINYERKGIIAGNPLAGKFSLEIPNTAKYFFDNKGDLNSKYKSNFTEIAVESGVNTVLLMGVHYEGFNQKINSVAEIDNQQFGMLLRLADGKYVAKSLVQQTGTCQNPESDPISSPCGVPFTTNEGIVASCVTINGGQPDYYFCDRIMGSFRFQKYN